MKDYNSDKCYEKEYGRNYLGHCYQNVSFFFLVTQTIFPSLPCSSVWWCNYFRIMECGWKWGSYFHVWTINFLTDPPVLLPPPLSAGWKVWTNTEAALNDSMEQSPWWYALDSDKSKQQIYYIKPTEILGLFLIAVSLSWMQKMKTWSWMLL